MDDIQTYFDDYFFNLSREDIYALNEHDNGPIQNVISTLSDFCYGIRIFEEKGDYRYWIFYINNEIELSGQGLELSLSVARDKRIEYTLEYCKQINMRYPKADMLDSYNTFQSQLRTAFEKLGFFTVGNSEIKMFEGQNALGIFHTDKGVLFFPAIDKRSLYRWFFDENEDEVPTDESKVKKVYLILDSVNNLIKIGQSYYPKSREKTLHGVSPKWDLITTWIAPASEERELHRRFDHKRTRGEWFDLNFTDLREIKKYMSKYKKNSC